MNEQTFPDGTLVAYLDGELDAETRAAVEADAAAMAQIAALRDADSDLMGRLKNRPKPTTIDIGEAALGLRSIDLSREPHAAHVQQMAQAYWNELEPAPVASSKPNPLANLRRLVAELVSGGDQPAFAMGLRGSQEGIYQAGDYQIVVETDTDFDDPTRKALSGLVMGLDESNGLSANLWRSDASSKQTVELDEFGNFSFTQLESGLYELIISGQEIEIHVPKIEL